MQDGESFEALSVIIPTRNEEDVLEECLRSIFSQSVSPLEVIIVDGGSTDNTMNIARKFNAKIFKEEEFSSPANARNLGAENARGVILLMMDADIVLHKDCFNEVKDIKKSNSPLKKSRHSNFIGCIQNSRIRFP